MPASSSLVSARYSSCEHSSTLAITHVLTLHRPHMAGVAHPARHRCRLIRHLILPSKPPSRCCTARLRCSVVLPVELYARGRHRRLQIGHSLAVSLLSLSLITLSNHSSLLVRLCLHSLRHSLFLLSTHSDSLYYSPQTVFTTHTHTIRHGYQLGSSSWSHHFRTGMLDCRCFPNCLLLQPLHSPGRRGRRAQRETSVSSSPSNSAYCS
jgi:hypothetical protein